MSQPRKKEPGTKMNMYEQKPLPHVAYTLERILKTGPPAEPLTLGAELSESIPLESWSNGLRSVHARTSAQLCLRAKVQLYQSTGKFTIEVLRTFPIVGGGAFVLHREELLHSSIHQKSLPFVIRIAHGYFAVDAEGRYHQKLDGCKLTAGNAERRAKTARLHKVAERTCALGRVVHDARVKEVPLLCKQTAQRYVSKEHE
eukprot:4729044-Pleurochrysis_carterae.AAC.1